MLGVNKPIRMAIIPPETCASSSSVSSRVFSVSLVLLMIFSIQASVDQCGHTGAALSPPL